MTTRSTIEAKHKQYLKQFKGDCELEYLLDAATYLEDHNEGVQLPETPANGASYKKLCWPRRS